MELKLYKAQVVDINDPDKQGKIKIRIFPELEKVDDPLLPYAIPFTSNCSTNNLDNDLPEKGSTIRVLVDKYWKRFYYLNNAYFYNIFQYDKIESTLGKAKDASDSDLDSTYENIKFRMYEDGGLEFHNRKDGSHGFIHKSGAYTILDKDGSIIAKTPSDASKLVLKKDGEITVESNSKTITMTNKKSKMVIDSSGAVTIEAPNQTITLSNIANTLGGILTELINDLMGLTTVGSPTTQTSPQLTAQMTTLLPKVKSLLK